MQREKAWYSPDTDLQKCPGTCCPTGNLDCRKRLDNTGYPYIMETQMMLIFGGITYRNISFPVNNTFVFDYCESKFSEWFRKYRLRNSRHKWDSEWFFEELRRAAFERHVALWFTKWSLDSSQIWLRSYSVNIDPGTFYKIWACWSLCRVRWSLLNTWYYEQHYASPKVSVHLWGIFVRLH